MLVFKFIYKKSIYLAKAEDVEQLRKLAANYGIKVKTPSRMLDVTDYNWVEDHETGILWRIVGSSYVKVRK